jgi:hypothetical protein
MRNNLLRSTAFIGVGGILFNATPAHAQWPTFDAVTHFLIQQGTNFVTKAIGNVQDKINNLGTDLANDLTGLGDRLTDVMSRGFTQQSNYQKAAVGAQMQIADASNAAMARVNRDTRNAQIAVEHAASPQQCLAIDHGQGGVAAGVAAMAVAQSIGLITDNRGEGIAGQPAFFGQAQAVQAINQLHMSRYCSQTEEDAKLCAKTALPSADQHAWNLFGTGNLGNQDGINAANDYATNLVQPIVPAALRADQLASLTGQDATARRRSYNARMSLARNLLNYAIGIQAPVVALTDAQKAQLTSEQLPVVDKGSWLQAITLEVDRRFSGLNWAAALQAMPPATVEREIATELALTNYLALQNYRVGLWQATISATQMAQTEERQFQNAVMMPSPDMASK